jgi:glycosyltransferase involved in cell wall biosynthesis
MRAKLRVCWFGIYDPNYPRNDILLRGLRAQGVEIIECRADWKDRARFKLLTKQLRALKGSYDIVYAAYPSNTAVLLAKLLTRKPVVMDALYSMYDAVVNDRQEIPWFHPRALKLLFSDWIAALCSDFMIVDTKAHGAYWARLPFIRTKKMGVVYTGVQDYIFYPQESKPGKDFLVSFHGFYIPLQGVPKIVEAARLLSDDASIRFRLIGGGQQSKEVDSLIQKYGLKNIEQTGRVSAQQVGVYAREADVVLGVFGDTEKASRVVPNKVYEGMALRKPVITKDTPSVREIFTEKELMLIDNTPEALAQAIRLLKNDADFRERLAQAGYEKVKGAFYPERLAAIWVSHIERFLNWGNVT